MITRKAFGENIVVKAIELVFNRFGVEKTVGLVTDILRPHDGMDYKGPLPTVTRAYFNFSHLHYLYYPFRLNRLTLSVLDPVEDNQSDTRTGVPEDVKEDVARKGYPETGDQ